MLKAAGVCAYWVQSHQAKQMHLLVWQIWVLAVCQWEYTDAMYPI